MEKKKCIIRCGGERGGLEIEVCVDVKSGDITHRKRTNPKCIEMDFEK